MSLQVGFVIPCSPISGFTRSNPITLITLPVIKGGPVSSSTFSLLAGAPDGIEPLAPNAAHPGSPYPLYTPVTTEVAGAGIPLYPGALLWGQVLFMFPLGVNDYLVASRYGLLRVTNNVVAWHYQLVPFTLPQSKAVPCAIVTRGSNYYLFFKSRSDNEQASDGRAYYSQIDISGVVNPGYYTSWPSVALAPDSMTSYGLFGHEAILTVMPDFDLAMIGNAYASADGADVSKRAVLVGPAISSAGNMEATGYGCNLDTSASPFKYYVGQFVATTVISGGIIIDGLRSFAPTTYTEGELSALAPPGTTVSTGHSIATLYAGEPPLMPAFWGRLVRASETI